MIEKKFKSYFLQFLKIWHLKNIKNKIIDIVSQTKIALIIKVFLVVQEHNGHQEYPPASFWQHI